MASIQDRRSERPDKGWRVRYRGADGRQRSQSFARKSDAVKFAATTEADLTRGSWVDPNAGKVTLKEFAEQWLAAQTFDAATREAVESRLRVHVYTHLGGIELRGIRPSTVQGWLRGRTGECAPRYVRVLLANLSAVLGAAVEDGLIAKNPARSAAVKAPAAPQGKVIPWPVEQVEAVVCAHPERWQAVPVLAVGCGLRQGEVFGVRVDDIDFLGRKVHVRQQVKMLRGKPVSAPPKGGKAREVPLPDVVAFALAESLRQWPAREVTLPWR